LAGREAAYLPNPYKIFEEISDFPPHYSLFFDDQKMRSELFGKSVTLYEQYFVKNSLFGFK